MSIKNFCDTIGDRTRVLPASSALFQATAPHDKLTQFGIPVPHTKLNRNQQWRTDGPTWRRQRISEVSFEARLKISLYFEWDISFVFFRSAVLWKWRDGRRGNWLLLRGAPLHCHYRVPLHEFAISAALPCKPAICFTSRQCRMHAPGFWHVNIASPSQNTLRLRHKRNIR